MFANTTQAMTEAAIRQRLDAMNDFQVLRFFEYFSEGVFQGAAVSLDDVLAHTAAEVQLLPEMRAARTLTEEQAGKSIPREEAARLARQVLNWWAADAALAPVLAAALAEYKDHAQSAEVILALGAAVSMMLLSAGQFQFKFSGFGLSIDISRQKTPQPAEIQQTFQALPQATHALMAKSGNSPAVLLLQEGKLEEALHSLEPHANAEQQQEITLLLARFATWKQHDQYGLLENRQATYNKIIFDAIALEQSIR